MTHSRIQEVKTPAEGKHRFNWVIGILICIAFLPVGLIVLEKSRDKTAPSLPSPNGYSETLKAAAQLQSVLESREKISEADLAEYVRINAPIHREAAKALEYKSRIPVQYTQAFLATHLADLHLFKRLAVSLAREGEFLETQGKYSEAADRYLQILGHAQQCSRGGLLIDGLVAVATETIGLRALENVGRSLPSEVAKKAANTLEEIDRQTPSVAEILLEERRFAARAFGWRGKLAQLMVSQKAPKQKFEQKFNAGSRQRRQLMVNLAARAYELKNGQKPKDASALVPEFLKVVVVDPEKNSPIQPTW